jgi:hypothetical protein
MASKRVGTIGGKPCSWTKWAVMIASFSGNGLHSFKTQLIINYLLSVHPYSKNPRRGFSRDQPHFRVPGFVSLCSIEVCHPS